MVRLGFFPFIFDGLSTQIAAIPIGWQNVYNILYSYDDITKLRDAYV